MVILIIKLFKMNVITIESKTYSVNKKELEKIQKMQQKVHNEKDYNIMCDLEMELSNYLTYKTESGNYKDLGYVLFDFRI